MTKRQVKKNNMFLFKMTKRQVKKRYILVQNDKKTSKKTILYVAEVSRDIPLMWQTRHNIHHDGEWKQRKV